MKDFCRSSRIRTGRLLLRSLFFCTVFLFPDLNGETFGTAGSFGFVCEPESGADCRTEETDGSTVLSGRYPDGRTFQIRSLPGTLPAERLKTVLLPLLQTKFPDAKITQEGYSTSSGENGLRFRILFKEQSKFLQTFLFYRGRIYIISEYFPASFPDPDSKSLMKTFRFPAL